MNTLRQRLFQSANRGYLKFSKKSIVMNNRIGYYEPKDIDEYVLDLKTSLPKLNPEFLCIYFTNSWNPVSLRGEKTYGDFVLKTPEYAHLKINVDKYPKLKWFFDSKMEPGVHLYYFGVNLKNIGGINWDRTKLHMQRAITQVRQEPDLLKPNSIEFSQPYYSWEAQLTEFGVRAPDEATQTYVATGFRGITTYTGGVFTDEKFAHARMRK